MMKVTLKFKILPSILPLINLISPYIMRRKTKKKRIKRSIRLRKHYSQVNKIRKKTTPSQVNLQAQLVLKQRSTVPKQQKPATMTIKFSNAGTKAVLRAL